MDKRNDAPVGSAEWMHDVRNALNAISMSVAVCSRLIQDDERQRAIDALERAEQGLQRIGALLKHDPGKRTADDPDASRR